MDERDFSFEIETARNDPAQLRKIAKDIQENAGPRLLILRAIHLAQVADNGPHPLGKTSAELGLPRPTSGLPLYRYKLAPGFFERVEKKLSTGLSSELHRSSLAPTFVLWAADWFRRSYQGGMQRWSDIEEVLGLHLPQSEWRRLADHGFRSWGIAPLNTEHGNQRLSNLARQGGFPVAAISCGANWPRRFLERTVGELLGADVQDIDTAIAICGRNEYLLPPIWRSQEMYAICGELTLKIVELRTFADKETRMDGRPYSARLEEAYEDWRDELPMTLDGAAADLIDTLLEAKKLTSSGSIRVGRSMRLFGQEWRECLDLHLDGLWNDKSNVLSPGEHIRVFLQPSGAMADRISGRLAFLEHKEGNYWIARTMRSQATIEFPFNLSVTAEFHARGDRLSRNFVLPGGKPTSDGVRVFERRPGETELGHFSLIGQGSGGYKADQVYIDIPQDWLIRSRDSNSDIEVEDFAFAPDRLLFNCTGQIIIENGNSDTFLVRTGQSADRKDRLSIVAAAVSGIQAPESEQLLKLPLIAQVEETMFRRVASHGEVGWRFAGNRGWRKDLTNAGPGYCEFAWLDGSTGHVRDRQNAFILPTDFALIQQTDGAYSNIQLAGWDGSATLGDKGSDSNCSWKVHVDPPYRAQLPLRLTSKHGSTFELSVPLRSKEWLTTWDGTPLKRDMILGLADLRDTVARVPSAATLMGEIAHHSGAALDATWQIDGELGLSALRTDIAALMRPLGIDTQVRLYFHNGSQDHWYVTEFGNSLEWQPGGELRPKTAVVGGDVRVCGRFLGAPEKEVEFGFYTGLQNGPEAQQLQLPRLMGPWLVYLREGARVLTRPKLIKGDFLHDVPQHRLGQAMVQPLEFACKDLQALTEGIDRDPMTTEAAQIIQAVMKLAVSLNGLPPQTFEIFSNLDSAGALAPLLLYRCEEQHLSTILELFDGLRSSWILLPLRAWEAAFQAQGQFLVSRLDDPQWALANISERQNEIAARAPQLAPLICRDFSPPTWREVRAHFTSHTSESINTDRGGFSPFRRNFGEMLPKENFAEALMRVFDAPFAAALATSERITLDMEQILTVKDVERRHPDYFAKAYGYALMEFKNGRQ